MCKFHTLFSNYLMDEITLEDVQDSTKLYFESQSQAKHKAIEQAAKDMLV